MNKNVKRILEHPDRDEIISKLVIGISSNDIHEWLNSKYTNPNESKFVLSVKTISNFQDDYLDIYDLIKQDLIKTKQALLTNGEDQLELAVTNNITYKSKMLELVNKEIDVRQIIANLCNVIETRVGQVFDEIQDDPRSINTKIDRLLIDYTEVLGNILEKYYKFTEVPATNVVQHNVTLQVIDQHISVFHDVIKEVLSQMDLETSMYFMEIFNEKMSKLKAPTVENTPNTDMKLAEVKLLNETINKKINE